MYERRTLTGKTLRPRSALSGSAAKLGFSPQKDVNIPPSICTPRRKQILKSTPSPSSLTTRNIVRQQIALVTKAKRDRFIHRNQSLFLPLLPPKNYVQTLGGQSYTSVSPYRDVPQPAGINAAMKPYQLKGLSFLVHMRNNGMPAILGDEMGLGKTLQTLSLFQYLMEKRTEPSGIAGKEARPFLVICPLIALENWVSEAIKFTPGLKVLRFHGPAAEREILKDELRKRTTQSSYTRNLLKYSNSTSTAQSSAYDVVITTYEAFETEAPWFKTVAAWRYVVLDEGHKIKNYNTKISRSLQSLQAEYRVILTGTPLQNNLVDMWSLFHWLLPDVFVENTLPLYKNAFNLSKGHVDRDVLDDSRRLLELIMIRRMKDTPGVDLNLPPKQIIRLFVPLTSFQKKLYLKLLTQQSDDMLEEIYRGAHGKERGSVQRTGMREEGARGSVDATPSTPPHRTTLLGNEISTPATPSKDPWRRLLNLVLQLRKVCTHAYLMPGAAPEVNIIGPHVYENSGKFVALYKLINELVLQKGKKMIIFSNFTEVLDWTQDLVTLISEDGTKFECVRLDGNVLRAKRNLYVRLFQQKDSFKVFLISTKAGGIGLNLTAATEAVFMDEDWNPQVDLQAEARCHRIGQTKPVAIYKLCTARSVEEQMLGRIRKKLYLSAKITESMQNVHDTPSNGDSDQVTIAQSQKLFGSYSEFKSLLRRGTQTLAGDEPDADDLLKWDFDTMIEKCQRKLDPEAEDDDAAEEKWLSTMEKVECAVFDGKTYAREGAEWQDTIATPNSARKDRRKGKEMTVEIDGFSVNKASLECRQWESVPTLVGKDPVLKNVKRERMAFNHQDHCQVCYEFEGKMLECSNCPRVYHERCMSDKDAKEVKAFGNWSCFQHYCQVCEKRAAEAGGVIFRCRWCSDGYCEDCLDWDAVKLIGDTIDEYRILAFPIKPEAYYIACPGCNLPGIMEKLNDQAKEWAKEARKEEAKEEVHLDAPMLRSGSKSDEKGKILELIEVKLRPALAESASTPPRLASATMSITAPPTPGLALTARTTAEPTYPRTPRVGSFGMGSPGSTTPSKRKEASSVGGARKKRKKDRYEIEV